MIIVGLALFCASPKTASAEEVTLVINRVDGATELFFSARADVLFDVFDTPATVLTGDTELIDFGDLRNGTFGIGDALLKTTDFRIDGAPAGFEAMSLMVHPLDDKLPMTTPLEGLISIGVCTGPPAGTMFQINELHGYVGYFTDIDSRAMPIQLTFPAHSGQITEISVHDFVGGSRGVSYTATLDATGTVTLTPQSPWPFWHLFLALVAGMAAAFGLRAALKRWQPKTGVAQAAGG